MEGDQRGERKLEVPAWAPLPGKKLAMGWGTVCHLLRKVVNSKKISY